MKAIYLTVFLLIVFFSSQGQTSNFWNSPDAYLGQTPPGNVPVIFALGKIALDGSFACRRIAISSDGRELFYFCLDNWGGKPTFRRNEYFKYSNGNWNGPNVLNDKKILAPVISSDDKALYFSGNSGDVWKSDRTDSGWSAPVIYLKKKYGLYDFMITRSGNIYAGSNGNRGGIGDWGLYDISKLQITETDTIMQSLGAPINTPGFNGDFFIAPDESYIIISANETPDYESELYISYHKADNSWTNPKSLGPLINDGAAHRFGAYVSPDNKYLFYSKGNAEKGNTYWVRFDNLLDSLKHTNFEPYARIDTSRYHVKIGEHFRIQLESFFVDDDGNNQLTYTINQQKEGFLPKGIKYDSKRKSISGILSENGKYRIEIIATDTAKAKATSTLTLVTTDNY